MGSNAASDRTSGIALCRPAWPRAEIHAGRSHDVFRAIGGAKRTLYQAIVRNLAALDVPSHDIKITLIETPPENWGLRGGMPASEIDLGFKIDV